MEIRYHLDENVSGAVAEGLRRRGIDITTAAFAGLLGADDIEHIRFAASHGRVVVTHDDDFTRIHADGVDHAGICYCPKDKHAIGELIRYLILVSECLTSDEMRRHIEYL